MLTFRVNLYFFTAATCTILMNKQQCDCNWNAPTEQKGELTYTTAVPIGIVNGYTYIGILSLLWNHTALIMSKHNLPIARSKQAVSFSDR